MIGDASLSPLITLCGLLIVAVSAPLLITFFTNRSARAMKTLEWQREDAREKKRDDERAVNEQRLNEVAAHAAEVADQAVEAAHLLSSAQDATTLQTAEAARLLLAHQRAEVETSEMILAKVAEVHVLVNSDKTQALTDLLDSIRREVVALLEIIALKQLAGEPPSSEALAAVESARARIRELEVELADRVRQQGVLDAAAE